MSKYDKLYIIGKVLYSTLSVYKQMSKNDKIYIFEKPLTMPFQIFCEILNNLMWKLVQSVSLCHMLSKKLKITIIWQLKVGQNKDLVCYRKN